MTFKYGVEQEHDWSAMSDGEFRQVVRTEFQENYPQELRFPPNRLKFEVLGPWYRRMAKKGWIAPNWPAEYGGMGLSPRKVLIFQEEVERWGIARFQDHGILMVGPVLIQWGTEEQRQRYLPSILSCEHIWCQGYSEPGSGSDLASLQTRAVREGARVSGLSIGDRVPDFTATLADAPVPQAGDDAAHAEWRADWRDLPLGFDHASALMIDVEDDAGGVATAFDLIGRGAVQVAVHLCPFQEAAGCDVGGEVVALHEVILAAMLFAVARRPRRARHAELDAGDFLAQASR